MITSLEQCQAVQSRRVASGKDGYSKAVRTFIRKEHKNYREMMDSLPVKWDPEKAAVKEVEDDLAA